MKLTSETVTKTLSVLGALLNSATLNVSRNRYDFYADKLRQAATEPDLLAAMNRLGELLGCSILPDEELKNILLASKAVDAKAIYQWIREQPRISVGFAKSKKDDLPVLIEALCASYEAREIVAGTQKARPSFDINIKATVLQALSHGDDTKAGNAELFRRCDVRGGMKLPFYSANAIGGVMRDLLADHFTQSLGFKVDRAEPVWATWFFHLLYSGGIMMDGFIPKEFERILTGASAGTVRSDGSRQLRNMLPYFSMLGGIGKHPIEGYVYINDLRPNCIEWGTGDESINGMMGWRFLARRDDYEGRTSKAQKEAGDAGEDTANTSMLASTECLIEGVVLQGGIDVSSHMTEIERAALYKGLNLLKEYGYLGGKKHRGGGLCEIEYVTEHTLDAKPYDDYLAKNKDEIIGYLKAIGAFPKAEKAKKETQDKKQKKIFSSDGLYDATDDVERIISVCMARKVAFTPEEARDRWEDISASNAAGWLVLPSSDEKLFEYFEIY